MKKPAKLRALIAGYGYMGEIRHQAALQMKDLEIVGIADPARSGQKAHGLPIGKDYDRALAGLRPDLVFVCTPNHLIPEFCVQALDNGCHVFCEKPPGRNSEDVRKMIAAEKRAKDRKLMFGFNHRHHPAVQEAQAICQARELGAILWMRGVYGKSGGMGFESSWRNDPAVSGGGILIDQGIHMLDLARFFLGEFVEVEGWLGTQFWQIPVEDNAFVHLRNAAGQVAQIHSSATLWKHTFQVDLGLEEGYLSIRGLLSKTGSYGRETLVVGRKNGFSRAGAAGNPPEEVIYYDRDESWKTQMETFVDCIRNDKTVPESTSGDALRLMELIGKVYAQRSTIRSPNGVVAAPSSGVTVSSLPSIRQGTEDEDYKEKEVWPERAVGKYRAMLVKEAERLYGKVSDLKTSGCPACGSTKNHPLFTLAKARYRSCDRCESWFVSPRPKETVMASWLAQSGARKFWNEILLPSARKSRKETVMLPRARWVRRWLEVENGLGEGVCFRAQPDAELTQAMKELGVPVKSDAPAVIWFDHLDREIDPAAALRKIARDLRQGGKIFLTGWLSTGFDVSVLGAAHPGINPLERLNLLTPEGVGHLARRCGLAEAELSTPGSLDLQIVRKNFRSDGKIPTPPFMNFLLQNSGSDLEHELMSFLQSNRLSSHGRIVLKKK